MQGLGLYVQGLGCEPGVRVYGLGFKGIRIIGLGVRV